MNKTLYNLLAKSAMRDYGDGIRALMAPRERDQATFEIQFGSHKVSAVGFPVSLQTYNFELATSTRAMSFACEALAELTKDAVLPLVSKYYEPVYGELGLHYPSRYRFMSSDSSATSKPLFKVEYDYIPRLCGGKEIQHERYARN